MNANDQTDREAIRRIRPDYRSGSSSLADEFFAPCLKSCTRYRRAAGYFSSTALLSWLSALPRLADEGGLVIELIISPQLSPDDLAVLRQNADPKERRRYRAILVDQIIDAILKLAHSPGDSGLRTQIFAWLIANDRLTIKFAFPEHVDDPGIFHEKIGIFYFPWGDQIAFTGSANETLSGHERNYESIDVYRSWVEAETDRIATKVSQFKEAWDDKAFGLEVKPMSDETIGRIREIAPDKMPPPPQGRPLGGNDKTLEEDAWEHQEEAINAFLAEKAGILEMATGTGKTRTALRILSRLIDDDLISAAIVSTYGTDLLKQWALEIEEWLANEGTDYLAYRHFGEFHELGEFVLDSRNAILLVSWDNLAAALKRIPEAERTRIIMIHDEVHGLGSPSLRKKLAGQHGDFVYRLGLSATPERAYDEEGNKFIDSEVGPTIFEFPLEKAISRGILCEFDYLPIEYNLTENDRDRLQRVYARQAARKREGNPMTQEEVWIEISKVYKTAEMKPSAFREKLRENQSLIEQCIIFVETKEYGNEILEILHPYTHLYRTYYAEDDRDHLLEFSRGQIDCLVTCHRLSQGIDIRSLKNVVLFSSARSKLETIQRIGRCLRVDPQNEDKRATVVDFVRSPDDEGTHPSADKERKEWLEKLARVRKGDDLNAA